MQQQTLKHLFSRLSYRMAPVLEGLSRPAKFSILLCIDIVLVPVIYVLLHWLSTGRLGVGFMAVSLLALVGGVASVSMGLPRLKLQTYEQAGIKHTAGYGLIVGFLVFLVAEVFHVIAKEPFFLLNVTMALVIISVTVRLTIRKVLIAIYSNRCQRRQRVVIYGAGQTGVQLAAALDTDEAVEPVAFIDDNPTLQKILVAGLPVYSPVRIEQIVERLNVDRVVLAMPSLSRPLQARLTQSLNLLNCEVSSLPSFASLIAGIKISEQANMINPADFLNRNDLDCDLLNDCEIYGDSSVMITGAGGSIGSELARLVLTCRPKCLVLFDVSEHALYQINRELAESAGYDHGCLIVPVLGSVTDKAHVHRTLEIYGVNIVLHAAAYKHVAMVEQNRLVGLYNNVVGTQIVAKAAAEAEVESFVLVSTDKAVQPTSIMGASKRLAELLVQDLSTRSDKTRFSIVRFGNVLGSSGSVIPLFEEQITRGGPVTLTHSQATRYFMTVGEAARLVLQVANQAQVSGRQGAIFLLDMGEPVSIYALACQMIEAAGYSLRDVDNPKGDIEIHECGLRQGEKLHERLAMDRGNVIDTNYPKIKRVEEDRLTEIEIASAMRSLNEAVAKGDEMIAVDMLSRWLEPNAATTHFAPAVISY